MNLLTASPHVARVERSDTLSAAGLVRVHYRGGMIAEVEESALHVDLLDDPDEHPDVLAYRRERAARDRPYKAPERKVIALCVCWHITSGGHTHDCPAVDVGDMLPPWREVRGTRTEKRGDEWVRVPTRALVPPVAAEPVAAVPSASAHATIADPSIDTPEVVIVLDTETTGLRPDGRVCEIACAALDIQGGRIIAKASSLVHPGVAIPQDATRVHGITDAMVKSAARLVDVWPKVLAFVLKHCPDLHVVAHNAPFDRNILGDDLGRHGVMPTEWPRWRWHDSITLAKRIVPGLASYSLHDDPRKGRVGLVTSLKLAKGESHRAMGDVLTACALLIELRRRIARHWQSWRGEAHVWGMGIEKVERGGR